MARELNRAIDTDQRNMEYTVPLTVAAENGDISPNEYARRRANIVGEGTIFEYTIVPIILGLWRRLFQSRTPKKVLTKFKS